MSALFARRPFLRLLLFAAAVTSLALVVERAARPLWPEAAGPSLQERIDAGFNGIRARRYDCVAVGNSRIYRGINPDKLGVSAYNFAQDDDAFNQIYYKLRYMDDHGVRVQTLVIGVDYFQFSFLSDRRNFAYARHFAKGYIDDFTRPPQGAGRVMWAALHPIDEAAFNAFMIRHFTRPAALLLERGLATLRHEAAAPSVRVFVKDNGQYVVEAPPGPLVPVERDATRLPIQVRYFEASLDWARQNGMRVFLVMPPLHRRELASYAPGVIEAFDRWLAARAGAYGATYLNFSTHPDFGDGDFADVTHLTAEAADRWSEMVGHAIGAPDR
jgi:hypothetical protein